MSLARNKKGIELTTIIEILLVVVATGLIIGLFTATASRAEEKTSEKLCEGFNALRFGTKVEKGPVSFNVVPRACKTIDKKEDVPSRDYKDHINGPAEGAKAEIRDMMAKCWKMWLEGNQPNMFDKGFYQKNGCFVCYTFSMEKESFDYQDFSVSLEAPYYAMDSSDRCAAGGQGGKCMPSCDKSSDYFSRETPSIRCNLPNRPADKKCCIAKDSKDECKNKGGRCLSEPSKTYKVLFKQWQCSSGNCYIEKDKMASYLDYVQGTKGIGGGNGKVLFAGDGGFNPGQKYAVTFVSPHKDWNLATLVGIGTTVFGGVITVVGIGSGIGTVPTLLLVKAAAAGGALTLGAAYLTGGTGEVKEINYILISKYSTVSDKCAVEAGVGEK